MKKYLTFTYSLIGYILSLITLSFLILWVYPWDFMPFHIDIPMMRIDINPILINIALLLFFGLQHSLMARSFFKDGLLKNVPHAVKSATYFVASSIYLVMIFYFWQPIEGFVWNFQSDIVFWSITMLYILGWLSAFVATFIEENAIYF